LVFDTHLTNNSGVQGVSATIAEEHLPEHMREVRKYQREEAERLKSSKGDEEKTEEGMLDELLNKTGDQEPVVLESMVFVITRDLKVAHFPFEGDPAPVIAMFPEFRPWAHSSNEGLVGAGIMWGVFRFDRCEG
jgi:hypothetical protein